MFASFWDKFKLLMANWKTSIPGLLTVACATDMTALHFIPDQYKAKAYATCMFLTGIGLIGAKDADRSNAPVPKAESKVVS